MKLLSILALVLSCLVSYGETEAKNKKVKNKSSSQKEAKLRAAIYWEKKSAPSNYQKALQLYSSEATEELNKMKMTESELARNIIALQKELEEIEQDTSLTEEEKERQKGIKERELKSFMRQIALKRRALAERRADIIERGILREQEARNALAEAQNNLKEAIKNSESEEELEVARRAVIRAERLLNIQKVTRGESVTEATGLNECATCNDIASSALAEVERHENTNPEVAKETRADSHGGKSGSR